MRARGDLVEPPRAAAQRAGRGSLGPAGALAAGALAIVVVLAGCGRPSDEAMARPYEADTELPAREIEIVARIPNLVTYPCGSQCHDEREAVREPHALTEFHTERELHHGEGIGWCDSCHTLEDADELHLIGGGRLSFDESDRLCGQCHGPQHRDWRRGLHGIQTGGWYGTTYRRLCTACHDPHSPGRITLEALPPPNIASPVHGEGS